MLVRRGNDGKLSLTVSRGVRGKSVVLQVEERKKRCSKTSTEISIITHTMNNIPFRIFCRCADGMCCTIREGKTERNGTRQKSSSNTPVFFSLWLKEEEAGASSVCPGVQQ
jgi:hypothetical protein